MPETQYLVHNTTRDVTTRFTRRAAPEPPRMTLMLGGGSVRVLRNRPQAVTESVVRRMLPELQSLERAGRLKLTTLAGLRVDLATFKVVEAPPVAPPLPKPPLDSAERDKNQGVGHDILKHGDDKFVPQRTALPIPAVARGLAGGPVEESPEAPPVVVPEALVAPAAENWELPDVPAEAAPIPDPTLPESVPFTAAPEERVTAVAVPESKAQQGKRDRRR